MGEATFTFRVDEELKSAFAELAKAQDRTAAQLLRTLMREAIRRRDEDAEYDRWFRAEVEQALREADDPATIFISNEVVEAEYRGRRAELLKRIESGQHDED